MGYRSAVRGIDSGDYSFFFSSLRLSSFTGYPHHGQNRGYAWATAPRFGGLIPVIILFSFRLYVFHHSPVIPTTGKTVAMHGLPLRGSEEIPGIILFSSSYLRLSPVIPIMAKPWLYYLGYHSVVRHNYMDYSFFPLFTS